MSDDYLTARRIVIEEIARAIDAWREARARADATSRCAKGTPFTSAEDAATSEIDRAIDRLRALEAGC